MQPRSGATPTPYTHTKPKHKQKALLYYIHHAIDVVLCAPSTRTIMLYPNTRGGRWVACLLLLQLGTYRYHIMVPPWSVMPVVGEVDRMADCTRVEYTVRIHMISDGSSSLERHRRVKSSLLLEPRAWWVARGGRPRRVCASMSRRLGQGRRRVS